MENSFIKDYLLPVIKGALVSVLISLCITLIFALIIKLLPVSTIAVKITNQFIKVACIFLGCFLFIKESKGLIKGAILGLLYTLLVSLVFALISGNGVSLDLLNILFGVIMGGVSGIISVNVGNR